jgi:ubiquinone/menaquinone biosynthesis C-methylase UbiE
MESEVPEGSDLSADWQRRLNPTARFSDRAEIYHNSRPHYPRGILTVLEEQCGFTAGSLVVDVGAGTGLLAELFLQNGNSVVAVEPNGAMRSALTTLRSSYPRLTPVEGTAEAIPFGDHSANFITAGTAFHWFDIPTVRLEFPRVLKPGGWVVITVNDRRLGPEPFLAEYEQLLARFGRDFAEVRGRHDPRREEEFFAPGHFRTVILENHQQMDLPTLEGRILSSSYMPLPGEAPYPELHAEIVSLFERHQRKGRVEMQYDCRVRYGQV